MAETTGKRNWFWWFAVLPFLGFWMYGLFDLDEGFYASITAEMVRRGDLITPYFNGKPWFEKPILLYWISYPFVWFGQNALAARLSSVLCSLALIGVVRSVVGRRISLLAGDAAGLVLASSLLFLGVGRMMMTDAGFVLAFSLCALWAWEPRTRKWAGVALGLSILAKGPVGVLLFVGLMVFAAWRLPEFRRRIKGGWAAFVAAAVVVVSLWYVPAYLANGEVFVQEFLIKQNWQRFLGGDAAHKVGWPEGLVFYLPILLVGMMPWSFMLWRAWKQRASDPWIEYLWLWAGVVLLFFTAGGSKLPHYILPSVPPLAMLVGVWWASAERTKWRFLPHAACLASCLLANVALSQWYTLSGHRELHSWMGFLQFHRDVPVVTFQMTRRQSDKATGTTDLQETSHPSVSYYLDRVVPDLEDPNVLADLGPRAWVLTRTGRIDSQDVAMLLSRNLVAEEMQANGPHYRLWRIRPAD